MYFENNRYIVGVLYGILLNNNNIAWFFINAF